MHYYLADLISDNAVGTNTAVAKTVAAAWENNWKLFFEGGLFGAIVTPCGAIALLFFIISTSLTMYEWMQDHNDRKFIKLIAPTLILILLINQGAMLATGIQGIRAIGNSLNNTVLDKLNFDQNVNAPQQNLVGDQESLQIIKKQADTCKKSSGDPVADKACLSQLNALIQEKVASGKIQDSAILKELKRITDSIAPTLANPGQAVVNEVLGTADLVVKFLLTPAEIVIFGFLNLITAGVQAMSETSMLLTALISPIFVAAALLPSGMKSLIALLTAFWGIINYKFCYIIIVGLSAQILNQNPNSGGMIMAIITALFAPILAGILASGAGMGFSKAAAQATGQVVETSAKIAVKVASGGIL